MKHLIAIILLSVACAIPACADDYKIDAMSKNPVQLDVAIRFNAIDPGLALEIMDRIRQWYGVDGLQKEACQLNYILSTPEGSTAYGTVFSPDITFTIPIHQGGISHTLTGEPCYDSESDAKAHCKKGYFDSGDEDGFRYCCNGDFDPDKIPKDTTDSN